MICGIFRAGGDTKAGCILDLLGLYGFGIPAVLIVGLIIRPTLFVWLIATMFIAEDTVKGILCVRHFRSRKWIKQLTRQEKAPAPAPINE
jgi:Na+-driven multidrug efflux pump